MPLKIHDTLTGEKRLFEPLEPPKVRLYACGVTPYDHSHVGHARAYTAVDLVYRYLVYSGYEVAFVRNFTDVDDKIIHRANERGESPFHLAQRFIESFHADMDALGMAHPDREPRVSTSIPEIVALVQRLIGEGVAYPVEGDVYFAVEKFPDYGKLSKRRLEDMQAGARVEVDERKRNPMDFALWKAAKPGEPSWESPWGPGRPGWHIECSAMSMTALGETVDVHCGGSDLIFPHHENEIAQSEGATHQPFVRYWVHNGFVNVDKEKMSKSLGNFVTIKQLLDRYEPQVLRYFLVGTTHFRHPINFSDAALDEAAARLAYIYETLRKVDAFLAQDVPPFGGPLPFQELIDQAEARFVEAMDDDFNAPKAMGDLTEVFKALNELADTRKQAKLAAAHTAARKLRERLTSIDRVLNLFGENPEAYLERHKRKAAARRNLSLDWIAERVQARLDARAAKDWARADAVRDELLASGVMLMDRPGGVTEWTVQDVREAPAAER
jgi:cysteinyl-tRNA synthetase